MGKSIKIARCLIISGIDGSGKSTIIDAIKEALQKEGQSVGYVWLRFNHYLTKGMHALARPLGLSVKVNNEMGQVWQHQFYKSHFFCRIYLLATYLDTSISRWKFKRAAKGKDIVICDRWIPDILVDLATKIHNPDFMEGPWPERFLRIIPCEAKIFVVLRNREDLLGCRLENRVDPDFDFRFEIYNKLCIKPYITVVDNNGSVEESVAQILDK